MKYILKPSEFPKECYLSQALNWATFQIFPDIDIEMETNPSFLREQEYDSFSEMDVEEIADEKFCKKFNLPQNVFLEQIENDYLPEEWYTNPNRLKSLVNGDKDKILENKILKERDEALSYYSKEELFNEAVEEKYDLFMAEIFTYLKRGELSARGIPLLDNTINIKTDEDDWEISTNWYKNSHIPIPPNLWRLDNIDWVNNTLRCKNQVYGRILVSMEQLIQLYPSPTEETITAKRLGEVYVLDTDEKLLTSTKGRPSFPWGEFTAELVCIMQEEGLPKLQKDLIFRMQDWCVQKWNIKPSETILKSKIAPFYEGQKKVRNSNG